MPNDPFRRTPTPAPSTPRTSNETAAPTPQALATISGAVPAPMPQPLVATSSAAAGPGITASAAGPVLHLEATSAEVTPGEVSVVNVTGDSGLEALGALELTVEWNPAVAEVTGVAPGPWRNAEGADGVRFDADRVAGRARLQFMRVSGAAGLPGGILAKLAVRGLAPGTTLVRVTAGSASTPGGATPAPRVEAASLTVKPVS
jgi:hypothetical protein